MLKDNWEDKHGINLPVHTSCSNNMVLQPLQGLSDNEHLTGSSSKINVATLTSSASNLQDDRFGFLINQPTSIEPVSFKHQLDNQLHQQNHFSEPHAGQSLVDSNLQELITYLSSNYGPMKKPLETGTPEYMKLVEILKQSSVNGRGSSVEEVSGGLKEISSYSEAGVTNNIQNVDSISLTEDKSSTCRNNQAKISSSEKAAQQLWEGSLQLSSSVTLSAIAFFKSGEKLVGNCWPDFIEVKGKVRLEAFEKYVQDLPRSRNRGLMVVSICWNEGSSNIGLNGMKEVAKGYKKSSRVGFAQLLSGIDLYICPRSDPIITILAKYGFFKGMSVIDDKPDSMIGCVVWRKNRPSNPVGNTSDDKSSPNVTQTPNSPPGFSVKECAEKKLSSEKVESSQHDEPLSLPLILAEMDRNGASSSSSSSPLQNSVSSDTGNLVLKKRPFEDDDLPEFDFGVACGKSTLRSKSLNSPEKLDDSRSTRLSQIMNAAERNNNNNGLLKHAINKNKLFDDEPEWRPPEQLDNSQSTRLPSIMNAAERNNNNSGLLKQPIKRNKLFDDEPEWHPPEQLDSFQSTRLPLVMSATERNNNNNDSLKQPIKKTKLFDDDDMPEWCPPELQNQPPPQVTTSNFQNSPVHPPRVPPPPPPPPQVTTSSFQNLPVHPPRLPPPPPPPSQVTTSSFQNLPVHPLHLPPPPPPPITLPPPRSDTRASFSYQPFRPPVSSLPPVFVRPSQPLPPLPPPPPRPPSQPPSGRFNSNQVLWHRSPFPSSNGRHPQL